MNTLKQQLKLTFLKSRIKNTLSPYFIAKLNKKRCMSQAKTI